MAPQRTKRPECGAQCEQFIMRDTQLRNFYQFPLFSTKQILQKIYFILRLTKDLMCVAHIMNCRILINENEANTVTDP